MEEKRNIISSQARLSALAGMMFFGPFMKNSIKVDWELSAEEKDFILWYAKLWSINIVFLVIAIIAAILDFIFKNWILTQITTISSYILFWLICLSSFLCALWLWLWWENESIIQNIQNKWLLLKSFLPIINFYMWFKQDNYTKTYRWLKESIFLWSLFIFCTLLFWNSIWMIILIFIGARLFLLLFNVDIVPLSIKRAINSLFSCNLSEVSAYRYSYVFSKINNRDYATTLQSEKEKHTQWQKFWLWMIVQYVLFFGLMFLLYRWIDISINQITLWVAIALWFVRDLIFYSRKWTFLRIPVISEIVSFVFK